MIEPPGRDPLPGWRLPRGRGDGANELLGRADLGMPDVHAAHRFPSRQEVVVSIDESRQEQPALQVDLLGPARPASHVFRRADGHDARALNGNRLGPRHRRIHRADHAPREHKPGASGHEQPPVGWLGARPPGSWPEGGGGSRRAAGRSSPATDAASSSARVIRTWRACGTCPGRSSGARARERRPNAPPGP
jgi:hypothetical protein